MQTSAELTLESMNEAGWYNQWIFNKFAPYLKGDILEVGCGIGNFTKKLTQFGSVYAFDIDQGYLNKTKKLIPEAHVGLGDLEKGSYFFDKVKQFDAIVCINVLEHIKNDEQALQNLYKLLKPGGHLILIVPADQFLYGEIDKEIDHYRRYSKNKFLRLLLNQKFEIIFSRKLNFLGGIGWLISGRVMKNSTVQKEKIRIFNIFAPLILPLENLIEPPIGTSLFVIASKE